MLFKGTLKFSPVIRKKSSNNGCRKVSSGRPQATNGSTSFKKIERTTLSKKDPRLRKGQRKLNNLGVINKLSLLDAEGKQTCQQKFRSKT